MQEFQRARSAEQKNQRMNDIKNAASELFAEVPYHSITLTTIAERLGWSRASLYKYVTTKEEIFLELAADARDGYFAALLEAFPTDYKGDTAKAAKAWAKICDEHQGWALYGTILMNIIEVNVTFDRLKAFKKGYYDTLPIVTEQLGAAFGITTESVNSLQIAIHYHAVGITGNCTNNPMVAEALKELGIKKKPVNYRTQMEDFIAMCLTHWKEAHSA